MTEKMCIRDSITAVSEVEDALIAYGSYTSQMQYLHKENNANREAFQLSRNLYITGETAFLNVITAQRSWLSSEESLVTMKQNIRKAVVQLARALGGCLLYTSIRATFSLLRRII